MLFRRFWDITISCFLSPHVSVFRKSREKEKGGCRSKIAIRIAICNEFKLILFLIQTVYEKRGIPFNKSVINPYRVAIFDKVHYLIFRAIFDLSNKIALLILLRMYALYVKQKFEKKAKNWAKVLKLIEKWYF